jgi:allantoinase
MENRRYDYLPIVGRPVIQWPDDARIALLVCPNIEYFHIDKHIPPAQDPQVPDVPAYTLRDFGSRIGVFRMMDVLDKHGIRASVLLNSDVCEQHPKIIEEGKKRNWEWLGHGTTNNLRLTHYPLEEEREVIRQVKETITASVGTAPKGWLGPGGGVQTFNTPDHLAAEGFEYTCDWGFDEQPIPMRVRSGRMIAMPYQQGVNDIQVLHYANHTPEDYLRMVCDQFDVLYEDGEKSGRVMTLPLHPFVIGLPFRIKYLDKALDYICSHNKVWRATGWEVASWYYEHHYEDPGPP